MAFGVWLVRVECHHLHRIRSIMVHQHHSVASRDKVAAQHFTLRENAGQEGHRRLWRADGEKWGHRDQEVGHERQGGR